MKDSNVDTAYVAVPSSLHAAVSRAAFAAGKNVVCEKPLASNATEAAALVAEAKEAGVFLWEAVVTTRQPNFQMVRDELLPRVGDVKVATVNYSQRSSRYDAFRACQGGVRVRGTCQGDGFSRHVDLKRDKGARHLCPAYAYQLAASSTSSASKSPR